MNEMKMNTGRMNKDRLARLKKRDERIKSGFLRRCGEQYNGIRKYTHDAIIAMLADEFPPLSESYIRKIIFNRNVYGNETESKEQK